MLHNFYRDKFLLQHSGNGSQSAEELRRQMINRRAACRDGRQCVDQLTEAFAASASAGCRGCCLDVEVIDRRQNLAQFAEWRAAQLRKSALTDQAVIRCWSPVQTVPIDWASIRSRRPCLCPFLVPNGGGLMWRPACPEAACLLLAQACGVGVDLHLRLAAAEGPAVTPCHSFLMGNFVQLYKSGQWPPKQRLTKDREGRRLILDLEADCCPPEVVQFVFYSAYGHVICLRENQRVPTPEGLSSLYTVARHVIAEIDSDFRRLADVSGLLANIIVLLNQCVGRLQLVADRHLLDDLEAIFRLSPKLFGNIRARLTERIRIEATGQLTALDESPIESLHQHQQSQLRDDRDFAGKDCLVVKVCATLFREMVLREKQQTPPRPLESCLQCYLAHLVDLHETDRCAAMLQACRDLRCSTGLLSLLMTDQPSSCPSPEHSRLCRMLNHVIQTLLQLTCDQAVLNLADAATFVIRSQLANNPTTSGGSILAVDFRFVTAFTDAAMSALSQCSCSSEEDDEDKPLSSGLLRGLRKDLSKPEVLAMLKYQEATADFEVARQRLISGAKSTELSDIACHSRLPRLRLLAQSVAALLLGKQLSMDCNNNDDSSIDSRLCSEGRRLLIGGGGSGLVSRLRRAGPESFNGLLTLLSRPQLGRPLMQLGGAAGPDAAELPPTASLLMDWIRSATRCLELLRKTSRTFANPEAVQRGLLRAGGCFEVGGRAELLRRLADELLAGGEMEPERFSALAQLLAMQSCGAADEEEKLEELDFDEEATKPLKEAAANSKASFLMRLLPSLQGQQGLGENSS